MKNRLTVLLVGSIIIAAIFKSWLINAQIIGGDWPYFFKEALRGFSLRPPFWSRLDGNGFGGQNLLYSLDSYLYLIVTVFVKILRVQWEIIYKVFFFGFFLALSLFSSSFFFKKCFTRIRSWQVLIGGIIYVTNTYILMIVGGGQMGIAIAYSVAPLVLYAFFNLIDKNTIRNSLYFAVLVSAQTLFDPRITYIVLLGCFIYWILIELENINLAKILKSFIYSFGIPGLITLLLNSFWIVPLLFERTNPFISLGSAYNSIQSVRFFSFAKLENTISLLHPNWPENIFGKVGFMRPEFLLIPILAFASLLFIGKETKEKRKYILFFALIGLIGAFLAKGSNDPFGFVYLWLFKNFPGFEMFRDPTKWYILVVLSYSVLIPYSVWKISEKISSLKNKVLSKYGQTIFLLLFVLFWLFTIRQAVFGQLGGTFRTTTVPNDYVKLEQFLAQQDSFSRTFWVPSTQRFGFYSNTHPEISANTLYNATSISDVLKEFNNPQTEKFLQYSAVKYVIVPYDSQKEIFLRDRNFDNKLYLETINQLKSIKWLKQVDCSIASLFHCSGNNPFGKIMVFEVPHPEDHFWSPNKNLKIKYSYVNPTQYRVQVSNAKQGDILVFSENFDQGWMIDGANSQQYSKKFYDKFNSFVLKKNGDYEIKVYYSPQKWVNMGSIISLITVIVVLVVLIISVFRTKTT